MDNVIFDFGNVLVKWRPWNALADHFEDETQMAETLDEIGFFHWNARQDAGRSWADGLAWAEEHRPDHAHIFHAYSAGLEAAHRDPVEGTADLALRLHESGTALFGLTNAARESVAAVRNVAPILAFMQDVVVSAEEGVIKPDPAIFRILIQRNGLDPAKTLFVDDSAANCEAAAGVGLVAHHFRGAEGLERHLEEVGLL